MIIFILFTDKSLNILEITESIVVAVGHQSFLWPDVTKFTKAHVLLKSWRNGHYSLHKRYKQSLFHKHILGQDLWCFWQYRAELWWSPVANRHFCGFKDAVTNGQGELLKASVLKIPFMSSKYLWLNMWMFP